MKLFVKVLSFLIVLTLGATALTSCGAGSEAEGSSDTQDTKDPETESPAEEGKTETWGKFEVFVPAGMEFKGGDVFDPDDTRYFSVKRSDFAYFDFNGEDSETGMNKYNYNKSTYTNGQADVTLTIGGVEWTGFTYDAFGIPAFELYGTVNDTFVRVSSAGFKTDSAEAKAVIGSLKIN